MFERTGDNVPVAVLPFKFITFWVQIHDLPVHCMTPVIRDSIGKSLDTVIEMSDTEEEGGKGNHRRVRVRLDISKPLSCIRKI